jgi:hypothetical protein
MNALPPLHSDLGVHFLALAATFVSKNEKTTTRPVSSLQIPPLTTGDTASSPVAVGFWIQHKEFFDFCIACHSKFSLTAKLIPKFPVSVIGDDFFRLGTYRMDLDSIEIYTKGRKWETVYTFVDDEDEFDFMPDGTYYYFTLV